MGSIPYGFTGKSVIVTGAARGVGQALAPHFAEAKATVFMADFDEDELDKAAREVGAIGIPADVNDTGDVENVVAAVIAETGRIDILIINAGVLRAKVLWKLTDEDRDGALKVHASSTFRFTRACVSHFRSQDFGRVVNISSSNPKEKIAEAAGPISRFADPAEMGDAFCFHASEEAGHVTRRHPSGRRRHLHLSDATFGRN